jgi:hypothetical protein
MSKFSLISNKADRILGMTAAAVAATTGAGLVGNAPEASADIVYSGPVNINIPDNIDGVYMNIITGATGAVPPANWDINPYSAVAGQFNLWGFDTTTWFNPSGVIGNAAGYVLPFGTAIGSGPTNFFRPGGGTNVGTAVTLNAANLFGIEFLAEEAGGTTHYGWVQITFGATAGQRAITGYAYESTPNATINAGAIPEPGTFAALALGAVGLVARRRRTA